MKIFRLLIILGLLVAGKVSAQGFLHTYGPDTSSARDVVQTLDGGYFAVGRVADQGIWVLRTDAVGQTLWSNFLTLNGARALSACAAPDGGFVILAENYLDAGVNRNIVLKLTPSGVFQWMHSINNVNLVNGLSDLIALSDGHYLAAGVTQDAGFNSRNWLVKIAPDGSILWKKIFGASGRIIKRLVELPNGEIVVSGHLFDLYLAKTSADGDLIWEYNYPEPGTQTNYDLSATTDGNIALLATSPNSNTGTLNISILKTDGNGAKLWSKNYYPFPFPANPPLLPVLSGFAQDDAGNFYLPFWGYLDDPSDSNLQLLKLSADGSAIWKHALNVSGNAWGILQTNDNRLVVVGDNNGFPPKALLLKTDLEGDFLSNKISGSVFRDDDVDCAHTPGEPGIANFMVKAANATGEEFYKRTNPDGSYEITVTEGDFALSVRPSFAPNTYYAQCDTPTVNVSGTNQSLAAPAIMEQILGECPLLTLEVSGGLLRRCRPVYYNVNWCNTGNLPAQDVVLQVIKSPLLSYQNSNWPPASQSGDTLLFDVGIVPAGGCEVLNIEFAVSCAAQLHDVICVEAFISPDTSCAPPNLNWDGSQIEVTGACNGDEIEFKIKNTGLSNMTQSADYVIIEDEIMYAQPALQLNAGQEMTTLRMLMPEDSCIALQVFPNQTSLLRRPVAVVANCVANGNLSLLLSLPNNENDPAVAVHCDEVVGSYDPNDKTGFPQGLTTAHYIEKGQDIEYRIRFQNTGTDTAFLVTIQDALPPTLDPFSIRPIAASHNYTWDVTENGLLNVIFPDIMLPDSNVNEAGSHGFVSFQISQRPNLPDGTLLQNTASIFFDFNEAVLTNTWTHTIGRPTTVGNQDLPVQAPLLAVAISPNPVTDQAWFSLQGNVPGNLMHFKLFDPMGKSLQAESFEGAGFLFKRKNLPAGLYFWQIDDAGKTLARGRLILE